MSTAPRLLALDPGLASFGAAVLGPAGEILAAGALKTEPRSSKAKGDKTAANVSDRARRVRELWVWLWPWFQDRGIAVATAEAGVAMARPGGPGSAAVVSLASGIALAAVAEAASGIEIVWATPREWRRYFVPKPEAEFGERQRAAGVPSDPELYRAIGAAAIDRVRELRGTAGPKSLDVHAIDAVGLGRWALARSAVVRRAMGIDHGGL